MLLFGTQLVKAFVSVWWPLSRVLATPPFPTPPSASVNPEILFNTNSDNLSSLNHLAGEPLPLSWIC